MGLDVLLRVLWGLFDQWFRYRIFGILGDMAVCLLLALLAITGAAEDDWDGRLLFDRFPYTFAKRIVLVISASAPLRPGRTFGEQIEEGGMPMGKTVYFGDFASHGMSDAYARKTGKRLMDTGKDVTDMPTLDEQDALIAEEGEVAAAELLGAAVPTIHNDPLLDVSEDDEWELDGVFSLNEVERAGVRRKFCEL